MDSKAKQWSAEETGCLLAVWSSQEIQKKLEGATRTKAILEEIRREMSRSGFDRSIDQVSNKLKKLKKEYRDQKKVLSQSGSGRPWSNPNFKVLDSILGDRTSCQLNGAFDSMAVLDLMVDDPLNIQSSTYNEFSAIEDAEVDVKLEPPSTRSSPSPSSSSAQDSSTPRPIQVKRKRDSPTELLHLQERADEREERQMQQREDMHALLLQRMERVDEREERLMQREERLTQQREGMHALLLQRMERVDEREERLMQREERLMQQREAMHALLLQRMEKMEAESRAFLGLMGRMVEVMKAQGRPT